MMMGSCSGLRRSLLFFSFLLSLAWAESNGTNVDDADDHSDNRAVAYGLVTAAGMSTTIGAAAVYWKRFVSIANHRVLALSLAFAAGVMLYVSFVEIFVKSLDELTACKCLWGKDEDGHASAAYVFATILLFCGVLITYALDLVVHKLLGKNHSHAGVNFTASSHDVSSEENVGLELGEMNENNPEAICDDNDASHFKKSKTDSNDETTEEKKQDLERMGMLTAIAIALHNLPEGLATFVATLNDPSVGVALAVAIAIHNIPEGVCVSVPVYYATGNRFKGFMWAFWSGIAELIGAALGDAVLSGMGPAAYGVLFGLVGGMMVAISIKELIPTAYSYAPGHSQQVSASIFLGMFVMSLSLVLFVA